MRVSGWVLILSLFLNSYAWSQAAYLTSKTAKKSKKNTHKTDAVVYRSRVHKKTARLPEYAPAGVATTLPVKRVPAAGTANARTAQALPIETPPGGQTAIVLPSAKVQRGFHVALEVSNESPSNYNVTEVSPQLILDLSEEVSIFAHTSFYVYNASNISPFTTVGKPELGSFVTLLNTDSWIVAGGLAVEFPLFNTYGGGTGLPLDPMRVWGVTPGLTWNYTFPDGATHFLGTAKVIYNSSDNNSNVVLERPLTTVGTAGLSHDMGPVTLGLAYHAMNWLGSGTISVFGGAPVGVAALNVNHGELFGSWQLDHETSAQFSVTQGFSTQADQNTYVLYESPLDVANNSFSVGLTHLF